MPRISYFYPARLDRSAVEKAPIYFGVFFVGSNKDKNYKSKKKNFSFLHNFFVPYFFVFFVFFGLLFKIFLENSTFL